MHWIVNVLFWLQIYEKKLQQYQDSITHLKGNQVDWSSTRIQQAEGVENVKTDLDNLNRQYIDQVLWANRRLQEIKDVFTENNIDIQVTTICLVNMFRLYSYYIYLKNIFALPKVKFHDFVQLACLELYLDMSN